MTTESESAAGEREWSWTCPECGWATKDTRLEAHSCSQGGETFADQCEATAKRDQQHRIGRVYSDSGCRCEGLSCVCDATEPDAEYVDCSCGHQIDSHPCTAECGCQRDHGSSAEPRAESAEAAHAEFRAKVEALARSEQADKFRDEACRGTVGLPYANNRYVRLLDDLRALLDGTR